MDSTNAKIKAELDNAKQTIKKLKQEIASNKKDWALYLFNIVQTELEKHHIVFNPHSIKVKASYKNKPLTYSIKPTDIICVIAKGKEKFIYLKNAQKNIEGILFKTDKIPINRNGLKLSELCYELDSLGCHLVQVSRSVIVNLNCYHQNKKKLQLLIDTKYAECEDFNIGLDFIADYQKKKTNYEYLVSLQRLSSHTIV